MARIAPRTRCSSPQVTRYSTASWTLSQEVRNSSAVSFQESLRAQCPRKCICTRRVLGPDGSMRQLTERGASHGGSLVARATYPYLIRGNCLYVIGQGWDLQGQDLRPEFRKYL